MTYFYLFILFLILLFLFYYLYYKNYSETFIGKKNITIAKDDESPTQLELDSSDVKGEKKVYDSFPPLENKSKYDLLNSVFSHSKPKEVPVPLGNLQSSPPNEHVPSNKDQENITKVTDPSTLMGMCKFYPNQCPSGKNSIASLRGTNIQCGDFESRPAKLIAEIRKGHLSNIIVVDGGNGYNHEFPPLVKIVSSVGNGASAKANVSENGKIESVDIIDYGYNYVETPDVEIEPPQLDSVCHLCCD